MSRHFPHWLVAYLQYTKYSEAPDLFHFWTGVWTVAGALRRRVWIEQRIFQWTPNFYIVFVGPPGIATKSTAARAGMNLLAQVKGIHFGPQSMTWQALTDSLSEANEAVLIGKDYFPMSCISVSVNELGTFLRPEDGKLIDVLVGLWDGQIETWDHATKTTGKTEIINPWINVIGCTTPSWLRANVPETFVGGGLTSRIIFVFGDKKRRLIPYPAALVNQKEYKETGALLAEDLKKMASLKGEYLLTEDALAWGSVWYEQHWGTRPIHMASDRFGGYLARKQTHIHKLAMVIAASQRDELVIEVGDLEYANDMVTGLEKDMQLVFSSIGLVDTSRHVAEILSYVRAYRKISQSELWRRCLPIMSPKEFSEATDAATKAGYLLLTAEGKTVYYQPTQQKEPHDEG